MISVLLIVALAAVEPRAEAEAAWALALEAWQQALVADGLGNTDQAIAALGEVAVARRRALERFRALPVGSEDPERIRQRLIELESLGAVCCDREDLWRRYGVAREPAPGVAP